MKILNEEEILITIIEDVAKKFSNPDTRDFINTMCFILASNDDSVIDTIQCDLIVAKDYIKTLDKE